MIEMIIFTRLDFTDNKNDEINEIIWMIYAIINEKKLERDD